MSSLNKVIIIGNLGQDPEVRYTQSNTAVATLSVATSEKFKDRNGEYQEKTEWHRVTLWDKRAEIAQKYLTKGSKVCIEGKLQTKEWEDKDGAKRKTTEILGLNLVMLSGNQSGGAGGYQARQTPEPEAAANMDNMDDDLPF